MEQQTDDSNSNHTWTQHPPTTHHGCVGNDSAMAYVGHQVTRIVSTQQYLAMKQFVRRAGDAVVAALHDGDMGDVETKRERRGVGSDVHSETLSMDMCHRMIVLSTHEGLVKGGKVVDAR